MTDSLGAVRTCRVCGAPGAAPFVDAGRVPVQCTALHDDRAAALAAPLGDMQLVLCPTCGTVTNAAFDEAAVAYDGAYENSQLFSPTFRAYAERLAHRLVVDGGLAGRPVVEVGSGKGEFLAMLAEAGSGRAVGYDPTYTGEVDHLDPRLDVHLVREFFDGSGLGEPPALVCLRHVLEHVADPVGMLAGIRDAVGGDPSCRVYVEVPDAAFTFTPTGMWDLIYQHCSYFSAASLAWVAGSAGLEVDRVESTFQGQFLSMDARPAPGGARSGPDPTEVRRTVEQLSEFGERHDEQVRAWRERLDRWSSADRRIALWGAGAKGVTFLNVVGRDVHQVVDLNPRKQGRYLPGTGHRVLAPEEIVDDPPSVVLVMNPAYEEEITTQLRQMGLRPDVSVV